MERRDFLRGLIVAGMCPICARSAQAGNGGHWGYNGDSGPSHWGMLDEENAACSAGGQQSPIDIVGAVDASLPPIRLDWKDGGRIVNNGHTIQVNVPEGSRLTRGGRRYDLLQYHFHAPSEHLVDGTAFPMEAHFVHRDPQSGALGVLGVFLKPGEANETFAGLAAAFPAERGEEGSVAGIDPNGLLPDNLAYWTYEGSLTTPPCSEVVDWMVVREPKSVAAADIDRFTAIYSGNARSVVSRNRRFILVSR